MGKLKLFVLAFFFLAAASAKAESANDASGTSEAGGPSGFLRRYGKANYLLWITGPRTEALSGNKDGNGPSIDIRHYPTIGGKFSNDISLTATQPALQHFNQKTEIEQRHFILQDPYITLTDSKLLHSDSLNFNLETYLRYYMPFSRETRDGMNRGFLTSDGGPNDVGHGQLRFYLNPTKTFLDGALTLSGAMLANVKFNGLSEEERKERQQAELDLRGDETTEVKGFRENASVFFDPTVTYSVSSKVDAYLEYSSGYLRHSTNGKWTSIRHPDDGQYVSPGIYWNPNKQLSVNPYVSYGPVFQGLTKADLGLQIQYTFL